VPGVRGSDVIVDMPSPPLEERRIDGLAGLPTLVGGVVAFVVGIGLFGQSLSEVIQHRRSAAVVPLYLAALLLLGLGMAAIRGLIAVAPGEARVVQLFGSYAGTIRRSGLRWVNPLSRRIKVSTRIRNHETVLAKVNNAEGNPIEIAAVVVWQVEDTARALYDVDNFVQFVAFQAETAVRLVATSYPYDTHGDGPPSLLDNAEEITAKLSAEIAARVRPAEVKVIESRITRLAYAPEIAQAMLRRQQASAVVAARKQIVEGAVGMVQMAL
jgi:regulator of protease activity HflC (stomatin/prohibitin superfamily)